MAFHKLYYKIKPAIPRPMQLFLRRQLVRIQRSRNRDKWPIDLDSSDPPKGWKGWPEGKRFALVLTHDVDTKRGAGRCHVLANLEKSIGFRSSFNFVPERYKVLPQLRNYLVKNGFEVGVHDLNHDGKLYNSKIIFEERAIRINKYLEEWESVGFRSASMHHNLKWLHKLDIKYDASTFDTDPFEPQSDGMGTIFPFFVQGEESGKVIVELPYTLPQDFTLFILMKEKSIDIWKKKLDWIVEQGGMALINVHPDYMWFEGDGRGAEVYPAEFYGEFLRYGKERYFGQYWHVLPKVMANYFTNSASIWHKENIINY